MSVEGLHTLASSDVPEGDSLVTATRGEDLVIRLELDRVDRVDVATEREPTLRHIHVP